MTETLTTEQANAIYDILVKDAGAPDGPVDGDFGTPRRDFMFHQTREMTWEYRFMGSLGFGGKFWNYDGRWYVTAYPEDMTPERQQVIDDTNVALAALKQEQGEGA